MVRLSAIAMLFALICPTLSANAQQAIDPLPSWNEGKAKSAILDFVAKTTTNGSPDFVPLDKRIATFDNDGTLWCEQPMYVQVAFIVSRVHELAPEHPEWKDKEPFKSILAGDLKQAMSSGEKGLLQMVAATHAGITTEDFEKLVRDWLQTARHPKYKRPYTECVYQPMLEVLAYMRASGYKTFIVSGGGVEFIRVFAEKTYGIPPEQVIGSSGVLKFELRDGTPVLIKEPKVLLVDDGPGKPVGIQTFIGRRPLFAFGNSDGDFEMLQWTTAGEGTRMGLFVHHDDEVREYAYDRHSPIGKLDRGLDAAQEHGWIITSMKNDWKTIFPRKKERE